MIENDPSDYLRWRCEHNFDIPNCPYRWCASRELHASLVRTRDKLRIFIGEHPDPSTDDLAAEWEAGKVLASFAGHIGSTSDERDD